MTVQTLAADVGVDPGDVEVVTSWLAADDEDLDGLALELAARVILDPAGQRTRRVQAACPECGRLPGPNLVLPAWQPCRCGGHRTTLCVEETGGCGQTHFVPELVPGQCVDPSFGFSS